MLATLGLTSWVLAACDSGDPAGPQPTSLAELFGTQLYRADGSTVGVQTLDGTPVIGIYYASPACPACGGFTPLLVDVYNELKTEGKSFEVVLVSPGITNALLFEYMVDSEMPWLAVSSQSNVANALVQRYNVRWVPTLILIDDSARTLSLTGRDELLEKGVGAYDDWLAAGSVG